MLYQGIGIEGLECFYSRCDDREIAMLLDIAESRGFSWVVAVIFMARIKMWNKVNSGCE